MKKCHLFDCRSTKSRTVLPPTQDSQNWKPWTSHSVCKWTPNRKDIRICRLASSTHVHSLPSYLQDTTESKMQWVHFHLKLFLCRWMSHPSIQTFHMRMVSKHVKRFGKHGLSKILRHKLWSNSILLFSNATILVQWQPLSTNSRDGHGHQNGSIICQYIHG